MAARAGTRGPAPKSATEKWLNGYGPRPAGAIVIDDDAGDAQEVKVPRAPATLGPAGRRMWATLYRQLVPAGMMARTDLSALELLAASHQTWHDATLAIKKDGSIIYDSAGVPRKHPAVQIQRDSATTVFKLLAEFGLSPRSARLLGLEDDGDGY